MPTPPNAAAVSQALTAVESHAPPGTIEEEVVHLFEQLHTRLLRYLKSFGVAPHDGEEIVQEVFLLLFQHLRKGKSRENLRGWVFRVAHNLGLKHLYSHRKSGTRLEDTQAEQLLDPGPTPEELMGSSQRKQRLLAVVEALSEQDRCCLLLRAEGLRYREIAEVLGMSLGAVANSLGRSITRLGRADEL